MPGKEIDRARGSAALAVARQHPWMVLFASTPALAVLVLVWVLAGPGWGLAVAVVLAVAAGAAILVRRD